MVGARARAPETSSGATVSRVLLPLADAPEPSPQRAAITSLGQLGTSLARPTLRRLARGTAPATCADAASCAARDRLTAAREALARLKEIPGDDAWRRHDRHRGAAP